MRRNAHTVEHNAALEFPAFEKEVVEKYFKLLKDLEPYPEWREKASVELDHNIRLLYDQGLFAEMGEENPFKELDVHKFFK